MSNHIMRICTRPHCAIRSHHHNLHHYPSESGYTFAKLFKYLPKICDIALCYPLNNQELIDNYNFLLYSNRYDMDKMKCINIFDNMLKSINKETNLELKKLLILYLFTMISTPVGRILRIKRADVSEAIHSAYYRMLSCDDDYFKTQIIINYRM